MTNSVEGIQQQILTNPDSLKETGIKGQYRLVLKGNVISADKQYLITFNKDGHHEGLWKFHSVERLNPSRKPWAKWVTKAMSHVNRQNSQMIAEIVKTWHSPEKAIAAIKKEPSPDTKAKSKLSNSGLRVFLNSETQKQSYSDPFEQFTVVERPMAWEQEEFHQGKLLSKTGASKGVQQRGDGHIQLATHKNAKPFTKKQMAQNKEMLRRLDKYSSVVPCVIVDKHTVLAPDGGNEVSADVLRHGGVLKLSQFKPFCTQMYDAHKEWIFFGDIKNRNFVVAGEGQPVRLVDLDTVATVDIIQDQLQHPKAYGLTDGRLCTANYITKTLGIERDDLFYTVPNEAVKRNRQADQFALLVSMIEATGGRNCRGIIGQYDGTKRTGLLQTDTLSQKDEEVIHKWINTHVKKDYKESVKRFLINPTRYALVQPLHQMMKWDS